MVLLPLVIPRRRLLARHSRESGFSKAELVIHLESFCFDSWKKQSFHSSCG